MRELQPSADQNDARVQRRIILNSLIGIAIAIMLLGWGWLQRSGALNSTIAFEDEINGIRAQIPVSWLLSEGDEQTVFRVQDLGARPFRTTIQVSIQAVGPEATPRNVVDLLKLQGPLELPNYRSFSEEVIQLGEDEAVRINYVYVSNERNPFLEASPVVVRGEDVVVLRGNQALIITYRDADSTFDENRFHFVNFLRTLEY
jgi:hypothetical protein